MSLGPVMVDLKGLSLMQDEKEMLKHPLVGGVILFSRNYESLPQLKKLVQDIHQIRTPRLIVAVDQEGGRVQRFREGFTRLPAAARFGELYDKDRKSALHHVEVTGWLMAIELLSIGVDISFAPVLDLDYGVSSVIGDRAFHKKAEKVADLAHHYMLGMRRAGMAATGKHFPGHGAVHADSHHELPVDERSFADLEFNDLLAFERMIHYDISALMMAHVVFPAVDTLPASFSETWIKKILREQMDFQGVVFSDDLGMAGAECIGNYLQRAEQALRAGSDMVLVCNSPEGRNQVLSGLVPEDNPVSHLRLIRMHGHFKYTLDELHQTEEWKSAVKLVNNIEPSPLLDMDME